MTALVPSDHIEQIVGVQRHAQAHYARAVSADQTIYILHSRHCLESGRDLRDCPFSTALDRGIDVARWTPYEDIAVVLGIWRGRPIPLLHATSIGRSAS